MEKGYKYLYLLKFKEEPLIKIGEGTKDSKSDYDRIKTHLRTYGSVFDLKGSYEVIAPKNYSISALERQLKDITALFIPNEEIHLKYKGKDGATEIRKEECLAKILEYLRHQQSFIDIKINQGISLKQKRKEKKKSIKVEKGKNIPIKVDFPFQYKDTLHKWELILYYGLRPNLHKIKQWSWEKSYLNTSECHINFFIVADVSLADDLYTNDYTAFCDRLSTSNKLAKALNRKAYSNSPNMYSKYGENIYQGSCSFYSSTVYSKDKKTCQINFSFTDRILYKKQSDAMKEINPFSPKEWFKTNVFEVLDKNIPEKKGN